MKTSIYTSLALAVPAGQMEKVRELVESEDLFYDVDAQGECNLVIEALNHGHTSLARFLMNEAFSINGHEDNVDTPLHISAREGYPDMVKLLLEHGAEVNRTNKDGRTPLDLVTCEDNYNEQIAEMLLKAGAAVNIYDRHERMPLHPADLRENADLASSLMEHGASLSSVVDGFEPIHAAVSSSGNTRVAEVIFSASGQDKNDLSYLHKAIKEGSLDMVKIFLKDHCNMDIQDSHGHAAIHYASMYGRHDITKFLLDRMADIDLVADNFCGEVTPLEIAAQKLNSLTRNRDLYVYGREFEDFCKIVRLIEYHIVRLIAARIQVSKKNLQQVLNNCGAGQEVDQANGDYCCLHEGDTKSILKQELHNHYVECKRELMKMERQTGCDSSALEAILTKNATNDWSDASLMTKLDLINSDEYPMYAELFKNKIVGLLRERSLRESNTCDSSQPKRFKGT